MHGRTLFGRIRQVGSLAHVAATSGFPLGSTIEPVTKGIWVWCVDHPLHQDEVLLLLDTEGLGDTSKGDPNHDIQLFTLATLLSSTLIYNMFGTFNTDALSRLNFVTEMSKHVKTSEVADSGDEDFDLYFPEFILTLRDFYLRKKKNGQEITSDEYLEDLLAVKAGDSKEIQQYNEPRLCLRKYFKRRKCFTFDRPAGISGLEELEQLTDADLSRDFVQDTKTFVNYVHNEAPVMKLTNGRPVSGRMYATFARNYVTAIKNGRIPCIQSAIRSIALIENESAVNKAFDIYRQGMGETIEHPADSLKWLTNVHIDCKERAFDDFVEHRVLDDDDTFKEKLETLVTDEYTRIKQKDEDVSKEKCIMSLKELHSMITDEIKQGRYAVPGGYKLYCKRRDIMETSYNKLSGLGVMKNRALVAFKHQMQTEADTILRSDKNLTKKEKQLQLEQENARRAEEREAMYAEKLQQSMEEMSNMQTYYEKETEKQVNALREDMQNQLARYERMQEMREQEISRLHEENVRAKKKQYRKEMERMAEDQRKKDAETETKIEQLTGDIERLEMENALKEEQRQREREMEKEKEPSFWQKILPWPLGEVGNPIPYPRPGGCLGGPPSWPLGGVRNPMP